MEETPKDKIEKVNVPRGPLRERLWIINDTPITSEDKIVSTSLYLQNASTFKDEIETLNDDERLYLFDLVTKGANILFNKLKELIVLTKKETFGIKDLSKEIKEANECIKFLQIFEKNLLLDNKQTIMLREKIEEMKDIEKNNK